MDQDDSMVTSPSSQGDEGYDDDNDILFPDSHHHHDENSGMVVGTRPRTPQNDHLNAAAPGELSPPRSSSNSGGNNDNDNDDTRDDLVQSRSRGPVSGAGGAGERTTMMMEQDIDNDISPLATTATNNRTTMTGIRGSNGGGGAEEWKPGQGWKTKKAQEDMHRAWENVVDRDFSLKEFGDVLAHRIPQ